MNNDRRKQIRAIEAQFDKIKDQIDVLDAAEQTGEERDVELWKQRQESWANTCVDLSSDLETIKDEEDEYRDAIPESLQSSDRYYTSEAASEALDRAKDAMEELGNAEENDNFCEMFHERYDDIVNNLQEAAN